MLVEEKGNFGMPSPVEYRIRRLCAQLQAPNNDAEGVRLLFELRDATAEYIQNIRTMSVKVIPRAYGSDREAA